MLRELMWRFKFGCRTIVNKIKNIRFTKYHMKYWMWKMILSLSFAFKGLVGLITLGLIDPDITARPSMNSARMLGRVKEFLEVENAKKADPESELAQKQVASSTSRFELPDDDELDRILAKNIGAGAYEDTNKKKSRIGKVTITQDGKTISEKDTKEDA